MDDKSGIQGALPNSGQPIRRAAMYEQQTAAAFVQYVDLLPVFPDRMDAYKNAITDGHSDSALARLASDKIRELKDKTIPNKKQVSSFLRSVKNLG
jgi:hypothetical protein